MRYCVLTLLMVMLCNGLFSQDMNVSKPVNLGEGVNSTFDEYFPTFTADDSLMIFTRKVFNTYGIEHEDFFVSRKLGDDMWGLAESLQGAINTDCNEGTPSLSADGSILLFTGCESSRSNVCRSTLGRCDIFFSIKHGGAWGEAMNLGKPVNSADYESQPSLASDGRTLYFVRAEVDSKGKTNQDIFYSTLNDSGVWSEPVRLSNKINTKGRESSPFIHPDGSTLYFASNGHPGMGGMDIFMSRKDDSGNWGKAINLGASINTTADETSLVVSASGQWGYFSSNRVDGFGGIDIYRFEMPEELKPKKTVLMKNEAIVLDDIFFDSDDFTLKTESRPALDDVAKMMVNNKNLTIEIGGHTDSSGDANYNLTLSNERAKSVYNYLLNNGVPQSRIGYNGYGATKPIDSNETESGRARNRRIEMILNGVMLSQ